MTTTIPITGTLVIDGANVPFTGSGAIPDPVPGAAGVSPTAAAVAAALAGTPSFVAAVAAAAAVTTKAPTTGTTSTPPPASTGKATASPDGTVAPPAKQIIDAAGNVWTLAANPASPTSGNSVYLNGKIDLSTSSVTALIYAAGVVYHQSSAVSVNGACGLWSWNNGAWSAAPVTLPAAYKAPACTPAGSTAPPATTTPPPVTTPPPATTGALNTPAKVLAHFATLKAAKEVDIGQHLDFWVAGGILDCFSPLNPVPAIMGISVGIGGFDDAPEIAAANQQLAAGGLVLVSTWPGDPAAGPVVGGAINNPAVNFASITTPGTTAYNNWQTYITYLAGVAKQIKGPFMLRLFHECNGGWFWWGNQNAAQFQKFFQLTVTGLRAAGVTNALYMFNINAGTDNYTAFYPGDAYVDIVSEDTYPPEPNDAAWTALTALNKPMLLAETGGSTGALAEGTFDNNSVLQTVKASYPGCVAIVFWCESEALTFQNNAALVLSDAAAITLPKLPKA